LTIASSTMGASTVGMSVGTSSYSIMPASILARSGELVAEHDRRCYPGWSQQPDLPSVTGPAFCSVISSARHACLGSVGAMRYAIISAAQRWPSSAVARRC
jgi:hypothetical protein